METSSRVVLARFEVLDRFRRGVDAVDTFVSLLELRLRWKVGHIYTIGFIQFYDLGCLFTGWSVRLWKKMWTMNEGEEEQKKLRTNTESARSRHVPQATKINAGEQAWL